MANALPMNPSIIALALALTASAALADGPEYPPGLFENSPLVPSGVPHAAIPSEPSDADVPFEPPDPARPVGLQMRPRLSDPRMRSTQTTFAQAPPSGPFAVWLKSGGRTRGAITVASFRHPPPRTSPTDKDAMVRVVVTAAAFDAIVAALPLETAYEPNVKAKRRASG